MKKSILLLSVLFLLGTGATKAQFTDLHNFNKTNGANPNGILMLSGGVLFGSAGGGGAHNDGDIFKIDTGGSGYKDLFDFNGTNGMYPWSLVLSRSQLFGMTYFGGAHGDGLIFSIDTNGNMYKDLFDFNGANGANPTGSLMLSGNILYGMTSNGGIHDSGCIFKMDTNGSGYKDIYDFKGAPDGNHPYGALTLSASGKVLYGMTDWGGVHDSGCIFSIDTNGNGFKLLFSFTKAQGDYPPGSLTLVGNKLNGMAEGGGANGAGCIFSIDTNGSGFKDMLDFNGTNGFSPLGDLTLYGNRFYGTTSNCFFADSGGTIFSIDTNGSGFKTLYYFIANNGYGPTPSGDVILAGKALYGDTYFGGPDSVGYVFKLDTNTTTSINKLTATSGRISLYPNPSNGIFNITLSHAELVAASQTTVEIYNVMGQKVNVGKLKQVEGDNLINISNQPNGVYLYRLITQTGNLIGEGKLIIQK